MHVISRKTLRMFWEKYPDSEQALRSWYHEVQNTNWPNSSSIRQQFGSASIINDERVVFNICGNKYRLVARINYASSTLYIRYLGTHKQYDKIDVETI
ncbi:type II toxin-antitoxin system HigB family toxin [bacterium]|nr:type II toxin-antitoxin system HigB family toxin [bacterium]